MTQLATDITAFTTPLFYDKIAYDLNTQLFEIDYIDDLYPVCFTGEEEGETFPQVYVNDGTKISLRVLPDSTRSLSFFTVGAMDEIDEYSMNVRMSYIVWMNLQEVDSTKEYDFTPEVIRDTHNTIRDYGGYDISIDVNNAFAEFTMVKDNLRPYSAFRIDFTKTVNICTIPATEEEADDTTTLLQTKTGDKYIVTKDGRFIKTR